jgi:hypothetical protein
MADNTHKEDNRDRSRVSASEGYEVKYFAGKHKITQDQARELIAKVGNNREKLDAAVEKLKKR